MFLRVNWGLNFSPAQTASARAKFLPCPIFRQAPEPIWVSTRTAPVLAKPPLPGPNFSPVLEGKEEGETEYESEQEDDFEIVEELNVASSSVIEEEIREIVEEPPEPELVFEEEELKPMKDHIDLDSQAKKRDFKEIAGSFWSAASVFSKKLQKWRQKQKLKKRRNGGGSARLPVEKPIGRQYRETQSEIADYGFGRRSCDTDPRFSLDAGRMSLDAARMSFDAARMSYSVRGGLVGPGRGGLARTGAVLVETQIGSGARRKIGQGRNLARAEAVWQGQGRFW